MNRHTTTAFRQITVLTAASLIVALAWPVAPTGAGQLCEEPGGHAA